MTSAEDWERRGQAVEAARALLAGQYALGTITVGLDGDNVNWGYAKPYIRGTCAECGAEAVMAASYRGHMRQLALDVARVHCVQLGHVQDYAALAAAAQGQ
jgi:hypothetical protein